jgi:hypothetical protein
VTAAVPEPSTYVLVIGGLSMLTMVRRRRFRGSIRGATPF